MGLLHRCHTRCQQRVLFQAGDVKQHFVVWAAFGRSAPPKQQVLFATPAQNNSTLLLSLNTQAYSTRSPLGMSFPYLERLICVYDS